MGIVGHIGGLLPSVRVQLMVVAVVAVFGASGCGESTQRTFRATAGDQAPTSTPNHRVRKSGNDRRDYIWCDANVRAKVPRTTCPFAENTFWSYWTFERNRTISVWSPGAQSVFAVKCHENTREAVCTTTTQAEVRIALTAVDSYSQAQADRYAKSHDLGPDPYDQAPQSGKPATPPDNEPASRCEPGYSPCLQSGIGDYDCAGGSGDGPNYTGQVQVTGSDPFGLDRDGDGVGCE